MTKWLLLLLSTSLTGCVPVFNLVARQEFKRACAVSTAFPWAEYEGRPVELAAALSTKIDGVLWSPTSRKVFGAVSAVAVKDKYPLIQKSAREIGLEDFDCPALKRYYEGLDPTPRRAHARGRDTLSHGRKFGAPDSLAALSGLRRRDGARIER